MARGDQLARQWIIFQKLATSRYGKSVNDLAADLDCHPRTVYRDLDALQAAGFPIYNERVNGTAFWSLMESARQPVPIPFSLPELIALYFSRNLLRILKDTVFYDSLESLVKKVKSTLPAESRNYLEQVEKSIRAGTGPHKKYDKFKDVIETLSQAVIQKRAVELVYYTMSRKKISRRTVEPYRIWFYNGTFYLIGHCRWKNEIRILFAPDAAGYVQEKIWHPSQKIDAHKDGSILFEVTVANTREIKSWVMGWGSQARVLRPADFKFSL